MVKPAAFTGSNDEQVLYDAARLDDAETVLELRDQGVALDATSGPHGWTALHVAAYYDSRAAAAVPLDAGASVNVCDKDGWTPLALAADSAIDAACHDGGPVDVKMLHLLLAAGADPDVHGPGGPSAFLVASRYRAREVASLLEKHRRSVESE
jgi:ankyrin repeat protein